MMKNRFGQTMTLAEAWRYARYPYPHCNDGEQDKAMAVHYERLGKAWGISADEAWGRELEFLNSYRDAEIPQVDTSDVRLSAGERLDHWLGQHSRVWRTAMEALDFLRYEPSQYDYPIYI